jgi:hypothetical protein
MNEVSGMTSDYVISRYKDIEHHRPVASGTCGAALAVTNQPNKRVKPNSSQSGHIQGSSSFSFSSSRGRGGRGRGHGRGNRGGRARGRGHSSFGGQGHSSSPRKCYVCNQEGHLMANYPQVQILRNLLRTSSGQNSYHPFSGATFSGSPNSSYSGALLLL